MIAAELRSRARRCDMSAGDDSKPLSAPLFDVFAANGKLFGRFDTHLDAPAGAAEKRDLYWTLGEQLGQRHRRIGALGGLYHDGFVGAAAQYQHGDNLACEIFMRARADARVRQER